MIEVGNKPAFDCGNDTDALGRCQAHLYVIVCSNRHAVNLQI